jgi:hypothetical protein
MPERLLVGAVVDVLVPLEYAIHLGVDQIPANMPKHFVCLAGFDRRYDAYNYAVGSARAHGYSYLLLWDQAVVPLHQDSLLRMVQAFHDFPRMDVISGVQEERNHINRVGRSDTAFMLIRLGSLDRAAVPSYEAFGAEVPQFFTADDAEFARICETAGIKWYEHGGAGYRYLNQAA